MKTIILVLAALIVLVGGYFIVKSNNLGGNMAEAEISNSKILVAYFSATGTTKKVAENLATATGGDIYEIKPLKPYTNEDLDWTNKNSRSSIEMADHDSRPEIISDDFSIEKYDTIYLGFPIWWYIAPTIVNTFLERYDFSNKTIILFATSGGSGFGKTVDNLKPSISPTTKIIQGEIINSNPSVDKLKQWTKSLKL